MAAWFFLPDDARANDIQQGSKGKWIDIQQAATKCWLRHPQATSFPRRKQLNETPTFPSYVVNLKKNVTYLCSLKIWCEMLFTSNDFTATSTMQQVMMLLTMTIHSISEMQLNRDH